jgi:hypothetical protein
MWIAQGDSDRKEIRMFATSKVDRIVAGHPDRGRPNCVTRLQLRRVVVLLTVLLMILGGGLISAAPAGAAVTATVNGSLIVYYDGVAHPGLVARDSSVYGEMRDFTDIWGTRSITRTLSPRLGVIYSAPGALNPATAMWAQMTLERWNGSSWVYSYRWPAAKGYMGFFNNAYGAWFFNDPYAVNVSPGSYRIYVYYWFLDKAGNTIGKMTEQPDRGDYVGLNVTTGTWGGVGYLYIP